MTKSKVYVLTDDRNRIIRCDGGYSTPQNLDGYVLIDEGVGDRYNLCQSHYFDKPICTMDGIPQYKLEDGTPMERTAAEIEADRKSTTPPHSPTDIAAQAITELSMAYAQDMTQVQTAIMELSILAAGGAQI